MAPPFFNTALDRLTGDKFQRAKAAARSAALLDKHLDRLEAKIAGLEAKHIEREATMAAKEADIAEREAQLAPRRAILEAAEAALVERKAAIMAAENAAEDAFAAHQAALAAKTAEVDRAITLEESRRDAFFDLAAKQIKTAKRELAAFNLEIFAAKSQLASVKGETR